MSGLQMNHSVQLLCIKKLTHTNSPTKPQENHQDSKSVLNPLRPNRLFLFRFHMKFTPRHDCDYLSLCTLCKVFILKGCVLVLMPSCRFRAQIQSTQWGYLRRCLSDRFNP